MMRVLDPCTGLVRRLMPNWRWRLFLPAYERAHGHAWVAPVHGPCTTAAASRIGLLPPPAAVPPAAEGAMSAGASSGASPGGAGPAWGGFAPAAPSLLPWLVGTPLALAGLGAGAWLLTTPPGGGSWPFTGAPGGSWSAPSAPSIGTPGGSTPTHPPVPVPEPASALLFGVAAVALIAARQWRRA